MATRHRRCHRGAPRRVRLRDGLPLDGRHRDAAVPHSWIAPRGIALASRPMDRGRRGDSAVARSIASSRGSGESRLRRTRVAMKTTRVPAIAVILVVLLVVLLFDPEPRRLTTVAPVPVAASLPSSFSAPTAQSDIWFCAAGTAIDKGFADHRVLLINT